MVACDYPKHTKEDAGAKLTLIRAVKVWNTSPMDAEEGCGGVTKEMKHVPSSRARRDSSLEQSSRLDGSAETPPALIFGISEVDLFIGLVLGAMLLGFIPSERKASRAFCFPPLSKK